MTAHLTIEELEALHRGDLPAAEAETAEAHIAGCAECANELAWMKAEQSLLARRSRTAMPPDLWKGIEARLPAAQPPVAIPPRRRVFGTASGWVAVAGAAAAMFAVLSFVGAGGLHLGQRLHLTLGGVEHKAQPEHDPADDEAPVTAELAVTGPVTLHLSTASADIEVSAGRPDRIQAQVFESSVQRVALVKDASGAVRVSFDSQEGLDHGRIRLQLPPTSGAVITTAAGSVLLSGLTGEVRIETASGDVQVRQIGKLMLHTVSGDVDVEDFAGPIEVRSVSGEVRLTAGEHPLTQVTCDTVSGELELDGRCAVGCKVDAHSVSGGVGVKPRAGSSFTLRYQTHSGDISHDHRHGQAKSEDDDDDDDDSPRSGLATGKELRVGNGEGQIAISTQSGDIHFDGL